MKCHQCQSEMNGYSSIASAGTAEDDYLWECPNGCDAAPPWAIAVVVAVLTALLLIAAYA